MSVSQNNTRVLITMSKELKEKFKAIAEKDGRSFSNLCSKVMSDYVKRNEK